MSTPIARCVLLANRHHGLTEGLRSLLETTFDSVVMVADERSLFSAAERLQPTLAVVDLSLPRDNSLRWLHRLRHACPQLKLILISVHDEPSVRQAAREAGADGFVPKWAIATDLLATIDDVLAGRSEAPPPQREPHAHSN